MHANVKEVYVISAFWAGSLLNEFYSIHAMWWFENIMSEKNLGDEVTNATEPSKKMDGGSIVVYFIISYITNIYEVCK